MMERRDAAFGLRLIAFLIALCLFLSLTWLLGWLLMPQRKEYGSLWEQYRQEPADSLDLLFFGSSIVYCDVAPAWIWEESGLRSWVMAGPEQTMSLTYYYVREALKTQSPRLVVLEAGSLLFRKYQDYSRANVSTMPLSMNRFAAVFRGTERKEWIGLLFPLYNYHSRWTEATWAEAEEHLQPAMDMMAGYTPLARSIPQEPRINRDRVPEEETYLENLAWLKKIQDICEKEHVQLLVYLAPSAARTPQEVTDRIGTDMQEMGIELLDLSDIAPELGIDDGLDWYDPLHFNISGAEKFSRWWGRTLAGELTPDSSADRQLWQQRLDALEARREELQSG
jgi:hypothetical protein